MGYSGILAPEGETPGPQHVEEFSAWIRGHLYVLSHRVWIDRDENYDEIGCDGILNAIRYEAAVSSCLEEEDEKEDKKQCEWGHKTRE